MFVLISSGALGEAEMALLSQKDEEWMEGHCVIMLGYIFPPKWMWHLQFRQWHWRLLPTLLTLAMDFLILHLFNCLVTIHLSGLLVFCGKKAKFRGIFRGKFVEKSADFAGKIQNLWKNRPISREESQNSWDFCGRQVKISWKIRRFCRILAEKSQIWKDFQEQILRKIGRFDGKFRGETSPRNNQ